MNVTVRVPPGIASVRFLPAVTPLVDRMKAGGYRFVTVSELLTYQGK